MTEHSARRILAGDVPYRDFWTIYAPGSLYALAAGFALFGRQLLVSHLLGGLVSLGAVLALHRLALRVARPAAAALVALLFAVAFFHTGYHNALGSYPPAILCIWLALGRLALHAREPRRARPLAAGVWLGLAVCFKHDLGGYAALACAAALLLGGAGPGAVARLAAAALAVVSVPLALLLAAGAGPSLLSDVVVFPLTHFRHVREQPFPLLPNLADRPPLERLRSVLFWAGLNLPGYALIAGLAAGWRRRERLAPDAALILRFAVLLFPALWLAGHVQLNTHLVTLTGLGALVGAAGFAPRAPGPPGLRGRIALAFCAVWLLVLAPERIERLRRGWSGGLEATGLPGLSGIRVSPREARWMRQLAGAIERAGPPGAPVLLVGRRNDVLIYASPHLYWLTTRPMVTRHQELHPGVTDTDPVQQRMISDLAAATPAVIVREHRFGDDALDHWKRRFQQARVPVGAERLDRWIEQHYRSGPRFGRYEVLRRR